MAKKWFKWGAIAFVAWFMVTKPSEAAHVFRGALGGLATAADHLGQFVSQVP